MLRPGASLGDAASLSLAVALAVVETLDAFVDDPDRLRVKWPNDVLLDGRKLAGILLEGADDGQGCAAWVVVGLGLNLAAAPGDGTPPPVALAGATGRCVTPRDFLAALAPVLARTLAPWREAGFAAIRAAWLGRAVGIGSLVTLRVGTDEIRGRFADLGEDGSVLLENGQGCLERYSAGELFFG